MTEDHSTAAPSSAPLSIDDQTLQTLHGSDPHKTRVPNSSEASPIPVEVMAGYVIESELGRGGMGVVYRARQTSLHRVVALKMIKQADLATAEDRLRFMREAEALARLEHPNIVRVYEVGEHQGKPFFSMEFVAGGSLDRQLKLSPLSEHEAAALTEMLARAMQVAHEAGIVHRDLKPANILLHRKSSANPKSEIRNPNEEAVSDFGFRISDFEPKVTDFGLAKDLGKAGQTQSGEVMGTPAYMAPEQAAGKVHQIDARTDVYALGVILYECLTGHPPFRAASAMDTLLQVIQDEPVSLRQLRKVHPDLDTICHKCLHKDPARRYAAAQDLAEDLHCFLAGEPILARPVTRLERSWRWCRRNPTLASLAAVALLALVSGSIISTFFMLQAQEEARRAEASADRAAASEQSARRLAAYATGQRDLTLESFNSLLVAVQQKLRDTPEHRQLKDELLRTARDGLARLSEKTDAEVGADPALVDAHVRLAQSFTRLGNTTLARKEYEFALGLMAEVLRRQPKDRKMLLAHERIASQQVSLLIGFDPPAAREPAEQVVARLDKLPGQDDAAVQEELASACQNLGRVLRNAGELPQARRQFQRSLALAEALSKAAPENRERQLALAHAHHALGELEQQSKDLPAARNSFRKAVDIASTASQREPRDVKGRATWMTGLAALAGLLEAENATEAAALYSQAQQIAAGLVGDDPYNMLYQLVVVACSSRQAELSLKQGDRGRAREYVLQALTAGRAAAAAEPDNIQYLTVMRDLYELAGRVSFAWKGTVAARNHYRQVLTLDRKRGGAAPDEANRRQQLAMNRRLADLCLTMGQHSAARAHLQQALALARGLSSTEDVPALQALLDKEKTPDERWISNSIGMDLVFIKPGTYQRGGEQEPRAVAQDFREERRFWEPEHPRHEVSLKKRFYLGATEVTRGQFRAFVDATAHRTDAEKDGKGIGTYNPNGTAAGRAMENWRAEGNLYMTDDHPVIGVSWNDAVAFCAWLSKKEGKKYRLPTEAEWEYACRGGTTTRFFSGDDPESLLNFANLPDRTFRENFRGGDPGYATLEGRDGISGLATVGEFAPNPFGLFDMTGNVWEWCLDGWDPKFYEQKVKEDPLAPVDCPMHPIRGGCFM